jgi:ankyrin repeat protein
LFLRESADYRCISSKDGSSILRYAAIGGDIKTMMILAEHGLRGVDISAKNKRGLTAQQHFACRPSTLTELTEAFTTFLNSVREENNLLATEMDDENADGEFYNVLEFQDP